MKFCSHCGNQVNDEAVICPKCGCNINGSTTQNSTPVSQPDAPNTGFAVLGFLIPLVGLILWLVYKDTAPLKARSAGKGALWGVIISAISYMIFVGIYSCSIAALL